MADQTQKPATIEHLLRDVVKTCLDPKTNPMHRQEIIAGYAKQWEAREFRAFAAGMEKARDVVITRTKIPADAKNPTRDNTVVVGEACADAITHTLEKMKQEPPANWLRYITGDWDYSEQEGQPSA